MVNMCVCVAMPFVLDVRDVDAPAGVAGGRSHIISPPSFCVLPLIFIARRIQPSLSFVNREIEFCVLYCTNELIVLHVLGMIFQLFIYTVLLHSWYIMYIGIAVFIHTYIRQIQVQEYS